MDDPAHLHCATRADLASCTSLCDLQPAPSQDLHSRRRRRNKSEYDTLTCRGPPDVHGQLYRSVRHSAFGGGDRRIDLRGGSSWRLSAEEQRLDPCDRTQHRARDPGARAGPCHR
jgi:hypothetical protein